KEAPQGRSILGLGGARSGDCRPVLAEVRQPQRFVQNPAIRVGVRAHAPCACRSKLFQLRDEAALFIEQLFGSLRAHPTLQELELRGILFSVTQGPLVCSPVPLEPVTSDRLRRAPALGAPQHNHWPAWTAGGSSGASLSLYVADL